MGLFDWLFSPMRRGNYGRLVAFIEKNYGKIDKNWSQSQLTSFMTNVVYKEQAKKQEKQIRGLKRYVELGKYRGLIKEGQ